MKIKEITFELRNDFHAIIETVVMPAKHCKSCGLNRAGDAVPLHSEEK